MRVRYVYAALAIALVAAGLAASAIVYAAREDAARQRNFVRFICAAIVVRHNSGRPDDEALEREYRKILVSIGETCPFERKG